MTAARAEGLSRVEGRRRQLQATAGVAAIAPHVLSEFSHECPLKSKEPPQAARRKPLNKTQQKGNGRPVAKGRNRRDRCRRLMRRHQYCHGIEDRALKPNAIKRPAPFCKKHNNWPRPRQDFLPLRVSSPQELTGRRRLSPLGMAARPSSGGRTVYLTNNCGCRRKTDPTMACPCSEAPRVWSQWSSYAGPRRTREISSIFLKNNTFYSFCQYKYSSLT